MTTTKTLLRACPVCGGSSGEILHTQQFAVMDDYPLPSVYDVVVCIDCGMVFADTPATQPDYDRYYETCSIYQDTSVSSGGGTADWDARRLVVSAELVARVVPSKDARILDIGCANGGLLGALQAVGFHNVVGVDPSQVCVENTRAKGMEAYRGELSRLPAEVGTCDLMILASVLEHVLDLKSAIGAMVAVSSPTGKIFLEVPDAVAYADYLYSPFQDFNTEHINHFSAASLDNLLSQFGFSPGLREKIVVRGGSDLGFPSLEAFYERDQTPASHAGWKIDNRFRQEMERYILDSRSLMERLNRQLEGVLASSRDVILWGTGQLAMKLLCDTVLKEANVIACVDGNSVNFGRRLRGIPIMAPEKLASSEVPVIVTTLLHADPIRARIQALGWRNPVVALSA
jgi:SAM-dependent methyltransferase